MSLSSRTYGSSPGESYSRDSVFGPALTSSGKMSPAKLKLQLLHQQTNQGAAKKDAAKPGDVVTGLPAKGKPRLMLMGQRR